MQPLDREKYESFLTEVDEFETQCNDLRSVSAIEQDKIDQTLSSLRERLGKLHRGLGEALQRAGDAESNQMMALIDRLNEADTALNRVSSRIENYIKKNISEES